MPSLQPPVPLSAIEPLFSETAIAARIAEMAEELAAIYQGKPLTVVALLRGSFMFAADLMRALSRHHLPVQVDFMTLSSYGKGTQSSGRVQLMRGLGEDLDGRHVLLVDDILETGNTLSFAMELLKAHDPASVKLAVLLHKPGKLVKNVAADYVGFTVENQFVVGYGLDYAGYYRELPYIGCVHQE